MSESKTIAQAEIAQNIGELDRPAAPVDIDAAETQEWLASLDYVLQSKGPDRVRFLIEQLRDRAAEEGIQSAEDTQTPYVNTIPLKDQPAFPGNRELERRIKSIVRWNAMAMVVRAYNRGGGVGGHISTFASSATLYEIAFNHFFKGRGADGYSGDSVYFQGHASPGMYSRAFLEGRLSEVNLENFRRELSPGGGLSSYPHPYLMPSFWEYPTVSMGLGPIMAIYQARFNEYLNDRGIRNTKGQKVWAFLGDGECDEPETLGAIGLAAREKLDNLIFVVNCNLQRLDGPVRGNAKIIQELEGIFRGAGWNVIKVVWGGDWDALLQKDTTGLLVKRMNEVVDGQYQKYVGMPGAYIRAHFFGKYPELLKLVENYSDEKLEKLNRGGHDPEKVYAAYKEATEKANGKPTVILAKTVKGYGLGEAGEGRNIAHNQKKLNDAELLEFRTRFSIPISDEDVIKAPFYKPADNSAEMKYLRSRREALGGPLPSRPTKHPTMEVPSLDDFSKLIERLGGGKKHSTTFAVVQMLIALCRNEKIGKYVVPIVPDESRTFGMEGMFKQFGIYAHAGQLYEPIDSEAMMPYKEAQDGQILEEGINECGSMSSFCAAGTAYSCHGVNMIPLYIYYSMFGFQRVGDSIWAAADMRAKGFLVGGTAGRTSLNGEGLQHQDGHSLLNAIAFPTIRAYDPAFGYEIVVIIQEGLERMYQKGEECMYYITAENDDYEHPSMPEGCREGIIKGMYKFKSTDVDKPLARVQLFGSGAILNCAIKAQQILADNYNVASDVWSVTSYTQLRREAEDCHRWNRLHPTEKPKVSYVEQVLAGCEGPFISSSDYVKALGEQLTPYIPGDYYVLGTDGLGRSETREALRRHFEVDAESIVIATLNRLAVAGKITAQDVAKAIQDLQYDPDKVNPYFA
jgi:pyruvate dehydrogenase E1 component